MMRYTPLNVINTLPLTTTLACASQIFNAKSGAAMGLVCYLLKYAVVVSLNAKLTPFTLTKISVLSPNVETDNISMKLAVFAFMNCTMFALSRVLKAKIFSQRSCAIA